MTIIALLVFIPILIIVLIGLNILLAPSTGSQDIEKLSPYECGIQTLNAQTRNPFSISFWIVAVLFLLFDLDLAVFYPLSVILGYTNSYGYWIGILFLGILVAGFAYEFSKGAIKFTDHRTDVSLRERI